MALQSLTEAEMFSPCTLEHQDDVFMCKEEKIRDKCSQSEMDPPIYLDISGNKSSSFPHIKTDPYSDNTLMSWTHKHPEHWTQAEILDWIYSVATSIEVDQTTIRGEEFQNITGADLCRMTPEDFQNRDPLNGRFFYDMFQSFKKDSFFIGPQCTDFPNTQDQYSNFNHYPVKSEPSELRGCEIAETNSKLDNSNIDICEFGDKELQIRLGEFWYPVDISETKNPLEMEFHDLVDVENHTWPSESGYSSDSDGSDSSDMPYSYYNNMSRKNSTGSDMMSDDDCPPSLPTTIELQKTTAPKRKTGSQRKKQSNGDPDKQQNRGRKPGQISKGNHLWEFIRDLLKDPRFNPQLLRWEEKDTGVFRFVQSEQVAKMWGTKKNNPGMTYEKLSRAMRFCRTAGYFAEVPKTGKFPKKLCFRFGPKAYGWSEE